jgi:oligopeptide transport system substrate-binding protein
VRGQRCLAVALLTVLLSAVSSRDARAQADATKVLRVVFPVAETGFDPQAWVDAYSDYINTAIFDPLYRYDYLARPYKIIPNTAAALPEISPDGLTWTIRIRPGILFAADPAFKGKKRELVAADYVYSWKRIVDPKVRSANLQVFDQLFVGADAVVARAKETGKFDYDVPIEGLRALDRYTLRIKLTHPAYSLLSDLTTTPTAAVAREVIEAYGDAGTRTMANPVGTGPYRLKDWRRGQKVVLEANPDYRATLFPESADPADRDIVAAMKGKRLPVIGRIEISIVEESNPRLLAFEKGNFDYITIPGDLVANVTDLGNGLQPRFEKAGVKLARGVQPAINYTYFNMEDPVVGGYTQDRIALRRAFGMAYNCEEEVRILWQGQAECATQPIPPGVTGYDPKFEGHVRYDVAGAKALLDKFGYVDRDGDGWRDLPDGKPLAISMGTTTDARGRQYEEMWQRSLNSIGVKVQFIKQKWPELLKMGLAGQLQMWYLGNISTTTDGYGFLGLLYGGHAGLSNLSRFKQPDFDHLYDRSRSMPDGLERTKTFREMSAIVSAYAPWYFDTYRYENVIRYPWLIGYKHNVFQQHPWQYYDIDMKMPRRPVVQ